MEHDEPLLEPTTTSSDLSKSTDDTTPIHESVSSSVSKPQKFERTSKQLAAFEKMRTVRAEKRKLGAQQKEVPRENQKSMEEAAAMFMAMRKKEKEYAYPED